MLSSLTVLEKHQSHLDELRQVIEQGGGGIKQSRKYFSHNRRRQAIQYHNNLKNILLLREAQLFLIWLHFITWISKLQHAMSWLSLLTWKACIKIPIITQICTLIFLYITGEYVSFLDQSLFVATSLIYFTIPKLKFQQIIQDLLTCLPNCLVIK